MRKSVQITQSEVYKIMQAVQKVQAYRVIKEILETNSERVIEFGFDLNDFSNIDDELKAADDECQKWWIEIANKYDLPKEAGFSVRYENSTLTVA